MRPEGTRLSGGTPIDADLLRVPVGPGSLHVERYGHGGQAVLLVHGFGTCSFVWRNVGPTIALANLTAFAVDLFGHGESDRPFDADYGIAAQAEYLDRALTALRVSKAAVVGLDLGGAVALRFAAAHPERVDRLVLINPVALDAIPADDVKSLQKNTGKYAFRVSRGVMGAAPLMRDLLKNSVSAPHHMPERLVLSIPKQAVLLVPHHPVALATGFSEAGPVGNGDSPRDSSTRPARRSEPTTMVTVGRRTPSIVASSSWVSGISS